MPGGAGSDAHDPEGVGAAYLEMPDFDGPAAFVAALRLATVTGEYRPHAVRYARRPVPYRSETRSRWSERGFPDREGGYPAEHG